MCKRFAEEQVKSYPAAELLQQACYDDYKRVIDTYDKTYEKTNIALAFCGVVLLVILNSFDYTYLLDICKTQSKLELFSILLLQICSVVSLICVVGATIQLLSLLRSRSLTVFDSVDIRNEEIYRWEPCNAAVWLIDKYSIAVNEMRVVIKQKQDKYDSAITKIVVAVLTYAIVVIIKKGV